MNRRPNGQLLPAAQSPQSSPPLPPAPPPRRPAPPRPSPDAASSDAKPRFSSKWLWITYMASALAVMPGLVLWDTHQTRQITQVEDLGLAKDIQWLGTSANHWLLRTSTGAVLTLESPRGGWAMEPNTRVVRTTSAHGKRWVCDASMQHCLRTAGEPHTLRGGQPS